MRSHPLRRRRLSAIAFAAAALTLGACGSSDTTPSTATTASPAAGLTGVQWVLDPATVGVTDAGSITPWIRFEGGQVTGNDGCNTLSGGYTADGSSLRIGPLAATKIACLGAAGQVADRVLAGLEATRSYDASATELQLRDAGGATVLTYTASTPTVEGRWQVTSVLYADAIRGVIDGTTLTADFGADGTVSGSGGCNTFSGPYEATPPALRIGPLTATERACLTPKDANEQEQGYLAALASARRFDQVGDTLTIFDAKGRMAVMFERKG